MGTQFYYLKITIIFQNHKASILITKNRWKIIHIITHHTIDRTFHSTHRSTAPHFSPKNSLKSLISSSVSGASKSPLLLPNSPRIWLFIALLVMQRRGGAKRTAGNKSVGETKKERLIIARYRGTRLSASGLNVESCQVEKIFNWRGGHSVLYILYGIPRRRKNIIIRGKNSRREAKKSRDSAGSLSIGLVYSRAHNEALITGGHFPGRSRRRSGRFFAREESLFSPTPNYIYSPPVRGCAGLFFASTVCV